MSATGTWSQPFWPVLPGQREYRGKKVHSAHYDGPARYRDRRVLVVGGAESGAQIAAELAGVSELTWHTSTPPRYLPDDVDGRELCRVATLRPLALAEGRSDPGGVASLGDVVTVPSVRRARDAGVLVRRPMFTRFTAHGVILADGREQPVDAVVWYTGFRPALRHLGPLHPREDDGRVRTDGTASTRMPGRYLVGYGDWTGPGSATLIGVGRSVRDTVAAVRTRLVGS